MSKELENVPEKSARVADTLLTSMGYISEMTNQLSIASSSSATNLDSISATSEQMAVRARENLSMARTAEDATKHVLKTADESGNAIKDVVDAMAAMIEADRQISSLVHDIEQIAFQTNLLALNAAVEAARAVRPVLALLWWLMKSVTWLAAPPMPPITSLS
jgi:methyl-accepting chemotaxis protein